MIDTIIFDLDGTLLNTSHDLTNAVNHALKKNNFNEKSVKEIKASLGSGPAKLIENVSGLSQDSKMFKIVFQEYLDYYNKNNSVDTFIYDEVLELIAELKNKNIKTAVLSNKQDVDTQAVIKNYFPNTFSIVIGTSEKVKRKPSTDGLLSIVNDLNTKVENCLYVGDSGIDIMTANNAGIKCISVTYGYRSKQQLSEANGKYFIDSPLELLKLI
jgi:phosphoglycolate phosphatase